MQKRTAEKVADALGLAEMMLANTGRPRKRPGKPRPEAIGHDGKLIKVHPDNYLEIAQLSLLGAIKLACMEQGYSRRVRDISISIVIGHGIEWASVEAKRLSGKYGPMYDNDQCDTRQIIRDVKAGRKYVEKSFGLR